MVQFPVESLLLSSESWCTQGFVCALQDWNLFPPVCGRHRDPTETDTELCLSVSCGGTGQQWTAAEVGALSAADLGMEYVLLEENANNPTIELPELT